MNAPDTFLKPLPDLETTMSCEMTPATAHGVARVNGVPLHLIDEALEPGLLEELAWGEILRQRAVSLGLLPAHTGPGLSGLTEADQHIIEDMLEREVPSGQPTEAECRRYYDGHARQFHHHQSMHLRHILFAVTPGVDVHALTRRAETVLLELSRTDVAPNRFAALAGELSNCPSGQHGGDLGRIGPHDCAPELAEALFYRDDRPRHTGLQPRLVMTRHGLHIIDVLAIEPGALAPFEQVRADIAQRLTHHSRARALHQYMQLRVGEARLEGLELAGATTPLVQ